MARIFSCCALLGLVLVLLIIGGCEQRITPPTPSSSSGGIGDTSYVEIFPPWGPFESPRAVLIGNDQLIYVADYGRDSVYMMDASGAILGSRYVLHPVALAQNFKLDLYIGAETISPKGNDTIGAVYRLFLVRYDTTYYDTLQNSLGGDSIVARPVSTFSNHNIGGAHMRVVWSEPGRPQRRFMGIGILPGNEYLVARTGPDNSSFVDPDTRVLRFTNQDEMVTPLSELITRPSGGTAITDIQNLTGIIVIPGTSDFIVTQGGEQSSYGAIWMVYYNTADFIGWLPKFDPSNPSQQGIDFVRSNRFRYAAGAAYDRRRQEIFIVDAELDSVVKFDRKGNFKSESFGQYKSASSQFPLGFDSPSSVAYSNDCTLYIADTGNKVIRRFRLSTQLQCY
jgi:hypothetical protein